MYYRNIFGSSSKSFVNLRKSSDIFGNFQKFTENVRERSPGLRNNFGKSSEIFGKSSKTPSSVSLYNNQNNTWTLGDMEFIFSCSHSISHSFAALTRSISMWTLEDKFHISARLCIILYLFITSMITDWIRKHEVLLSIIHENYNFREKLWKRGKFRLKCWPRRRKHSKVSSKNTKAIQ